MRCYFCEAKTENCLCVACLSELSPSFKVLPSLPNICLGGYFYSYTPVIRQILHGLKFRGNIRLGTLLHDQFRLDGVPQIFLDVDAVVCVRSHWFRQLWRGRPHIPFLFSHFLANASHYCPRYLVRTRYSKASYRLNRQARSQQGDRFLWRGPSTVRSVTVLDDLCTTGSTLSEIAALLKSHGVDTVKVLVLSYVEKNA